MDQSGEIPAPTLLTPFTIAIPVGRFLSLARKDAQSLKLAPEPMPGCIVMIGQATGIGNTRSYL